MLFQDLSFVSPNGHRTVTIGRRTSGHEITAVASSDGNVTSATTVSVHHENAIAELVAFIQPDLDALYTGQKSPDLEAILTAALHR